MSSLVETTGDPKMRDLYTMVGGSLFSVCSFAFCCTISGTMSFVAGVLPLLPSRLSLMKVLNLIET